MNKCSCEGSCGCKNCSCSHYASFFSTLGNETRLMILESLQSGPATVTQLIERTGEQQSTISHALKQLHMAGLVNAARNGKQRIYTLNNDVFVRILNMIDEHVLTRRDELAKPCCCEVQR